MHVNGFVPLLGSFGGLEQHFHLGYKFEEDQDLLLQAATSVIITDLKQLFQQQVPASVRQFIWF